MWKWYQSDKNKDIYLTGPLGCLACISVVKNSRYECTVSLPNSDALSMCADIAIPLDEVKKSVCKLARKLLIQCLKQLKAI